MIGMPSAIAAAGVPVPVVAAAAAGLPAGDVAFDDVFRQLTGGLLMTSAGAGEAAAAEAPVEGAFLTGQAAEIRTDEASALPCGLPVPVAFQVPMPDAAVLPDGHGVGVEAVAPELEGASVLPGQKPGAKSRAVMAFDMPSASPDRGAPAASTTRPLDAPSPGGRAQEAEAVPLTTPGLVRANAAAALPLEIPASDTSKDVPAPDFGTLVHGADRHRGIRETSAPARAVEHPMTGGAVLAAATGEPTPTLPGVPTATPPEVPATVGASLPVSQAAGTPEAPKDLRPAARRAIAFERALAQAGGDAPDAPTPGPATPVVNMSPAGSGSQAGGDAGAPDGQGTGRRQARVWSAPTSGTVPVASAGAPGSAEAISGSQHVAVPGAAAAWRAAMAGSPAADGAAPTGDSRSPALPAPPAAPLAALPVFELPQTRDRGAVLIETTSPPPELDAPTGEAVHTQIVKSLRMQWTGGLGEARVTLRPEYLGEVVASVKVEQGVVTATLQADTPEVRRWMETHSATLRDALVEHGLKLDRLTIIEPEAPAAQGDRQARSRQRQQDAPRQRPRRDTPTAATPFEVITE